MAISGVLWSLLGVLAGVFIVIQAPVNAHLTHGFGVPVAEPAISFLVGAIVLGVVNLLKTRTQSLVIDWKALVPGLFVTVGALGSVYFLTAVLLTPCIGTPSLMAFLLAGQILAGMLLDCADYLGVAVREFSMGRIVGALLLLAGTMTIRIY